MEQKDYYDYYKLLANVHLKRDTDLNNRCISFILQQSIGNSILDIACGRGYLCRQLSQRMPNASVYGIDIAIPDIQYSDLPNLRFIKGDIENIPFADSFFDTVICAHTIEHVLDIEKSLSELRRVTKKRLIIIVPKQREYKYTFDLHVRFFPYKTSLLKYTKKTGGEIFVLGGDFVYVEDR